MISKGFITAEVDKLLQDPKHSTVTKMDAPEGAEAEPARKKNQAGGEERGITPFHHLEDLRYLEEAAEKKN